ncbi:cytochrome oxidase assembly protein-domain-containing protein [Mucidula mucida]|nr:cytochrome oxidase assembly protein-domain-containing protein [Mucidula mucida]
MIPSLLGAARAPARSLFVSQKWACASRCLSSLSGPSMSSCGLQRSILWPNRQAPFTLRAQYATATKAPKRASKKSVKQPHRNQSQFLRKHLSLQKRPVPLPKPEPLPPSKGHSYAPKTTPTPDQLPILPPKSVGIWLMISSTSITEWKPITGAIPPLSHEDWEEEFAKYKDTPEFKMLNHSITLEEFKRIFFWEWSHRFLGRFVGMVFVLPLAYFIGARRSQEPSLETVRSISSLRRAGPYGWYMVKSGLDEQLLETPGAVPRVSQYRLAAHLGLATIKDYKFATSGLWNGQTLKDFQKVLQSPLSRKLLMQSRILFGMVFLTAMSGAFVAGLDAGLLYNEFPLMGGRLAPPSDELLDPRYSKKSDRPATLTYFGIAALYLQSLRRGALPAATRGATKVAFGMANIQVILGITTLWYMVPVPLAAGHQAGSVLLLTAMIHALMAFRRPSTAAVAWQNALRASKKTVS